MMGGTLIFLTKSVAIKKKKNSLGLKKNETKQNTLKLSFTCDESMWRGRKEKKR